MANTKRNMLAELEKRLDIIVFGLVTDGHPCDETIDIRKAQRIVAELAKVEYGDDGHISSWTDTEIKLKKCRAIAEEGAGDDK